MQYHVVAGANVGVFLKAFAVIFIGGMFGAATTPVIVDETAAFTLPVFWVCTCVVGSGAWYLSSRLARLSDRIESLEKTINSLPCRPESCPQTKPRKQQNENYD